MILVTIPGLDATVHDPMHHLRNLHREVWQLLDTWFSTSGLGAELPDELRMRIGALHIIHHQIGMFLAGYDVGRDSK